ncbi:MAG TPA: hypothetical protein VLR26_14210 [Frankiaceae bacterium]|nr:hypothetical protein [Frankiaceae bacterium]
MSNTDARTGGTAPADRGVRHWLRSHRWGAVAAIGTALAVFVLTAWLYRRWAGTDTPRMLEVEVAGSSRAIDHLVGPNARSYNHALWVDYLFIAGYGIALVTAGVVGRSVSLTRNARRISSALIAAAVLAVLCDIAENELLRPVVHNPSSSKNEFAVAAQAFSFVKWTLVLPAAAVAIVIVLTTLWRALGVPVADRLRSTKANDHEQAATDVVEFPALDPDHDLDNGLAGQAASRSAWRANSHLPQDRPYARQQIGFCVSGGGIRSATFALGAMDSLRDWLRQARYLVSVSGGGYAAGAMQLALKDLPKDVTLPEDLDPGTSAATAADVYTGGSAELDHTRKHGRYLAESAGEWTVALTRILRGVIVNLLVLGLIIVVVGRTLAHVYALFPSTILNKGGWPPPTGVSWAIGVTAGAALASFVGRILLAPGLNRTSEPLKRLAAGLAGLAAALAVAGIGLPALAWVAGNPPNTSVALSGGGIVSVLTAWGGAIVAFGKRPAVTANLKKVQQRWSKASPKQRGIAANVSVAVALLVVLAALLGLLGIVLATTTKLTAHSTWPGGRDEWVYTVGAAVLLALLAAVDQVRWSLHPFYRRRLATAFAVRRVRHGEKVRAVPYDFEHEATSLHEYGTRHGGADTGDFPQIIFSCAAHDSDRSVTQPGRRVVPWTMSGDYVGSPMIGWAPSEYLHDIAAPALRADLTVQAAQALSGAAIAAQMGRMDRAYSRLLAVTNAGLGSWLPNPAYLHKLAEHGDQWWVPRLPRRRYLSTLGREIAGSYPGDGPLLFVTDGGHYENLGLVELLRHRPTLAICIDGSGDRPDVASTFAEAIQLAYEELGVVIDCNEAADLGAGTAGPAVPAVDQLTGELKERLARSSVTTATISYPDLGPGLPREEGMLLFAKATLTRQTPFELLAHASRNPSFPNDSTADQWFDFAQFDAYHALGRHVGEQARRALLQRVIPAQQESTTIVLPVAAGEGLVVQVADVLLPTE